jgi:hypothetical protein
MDVTTHLARITGPIDYQQADGGRKRHIPVGPCLVERRCERTIDIVWGTEGQHATTLPVDQFLAARDKGTLVLLD